MISVDAERALRDIRNALVEYPFSRIAINDDGNLVFIRTMRTMQDIVIKVMYEQVADNLVINFGPLSTFDIDGGAILWYGPLADVPGDDRLLELVRLNITWEVT